MDRLYMVKRPFAATTSWVGATSRILEPGDTLCGTKKVLWTSLRFDGFKWRPEDVNQFTKSIEPFESSRLQV
jgi:hypothetical protein